MVANNYIIWCPDNLVLDNEGLRKLSTPINEAYNSKLIISGHERFFVRLFHILRYTTIIPLNGIHSSKLFISSKKYIYIYIYIYI